MIKKTTLFATIAILISNYAVASLNDEHITFDSHTTTIEQQLEPDEPKPKPLMSFKRININTANEFDLIKLSGIGEVKAQQIIAWREEHGEFKSTDDLIKVNGIGPKTVANIKDVITLF